MKKNVRASSILFTLLLAGLFPVTPPSVRGQQLERAQKKNGKFDAQFKDASFRSESLQRKMRYRVFLPQRYEASAKRYPTLYLLHGLYGDFQNWSTLTNLAKWAKNLEMIIVMPDAGNSWYVNSATNESDKFEDYIVRDFIGEVDSHFRTIQDRHARAIAGLSMGGYAALNFSLKHPQLFSYSGIISAALDAPSNLDERKPEFRESLQKAFGPRDSSTRATNDVFARLASVDPMKLPYFYIDCGEGDMFLAVNRELVVHLDEEKIAYEYHEYSGAHTWQYWNLSIRRFFRALSEAHFVAPLAN